MELQSKGIDEISKADWSICKHKVLKCKGIRISKILYMIEGSWVLDALDKFLPILDMNSIIFHFRMEDVLQAMLSHKFVRKNSNTLFDFMVKVVAAPHFPQALYGVDFLLDPPYLHHEL